MNQPWTGAQFEAANREVLKLAISALMTDGAHHKQWYLERIVTACGADLETLRIECEHEKGIAP